jgi:hypothetical protein
MEIASSMKLDFPTVFMHWIKIHTTSLVTILKKNSTAVYWLTRPVSFSQSADMIEQNKQMVASSTAIYIVKGQRF